jgi:hypothetical protein
MKTFAILTATIVIAFAGAGCSSDTMARMNMKHPSAVERIGYANPEPDAGVASNDSPDLAPIAQGPQDSPAWGSGFTPF